MKKRVDKSFNGVVVALEEALDLVIAQHKGVLLAIFVQGVLGDLLFVLLVICLDGRRGEGGYQLPALELTEIHVFEPVVFFELSDSSRTESKGRVSLQKLVDKGHGFQ